MQKMKWLVAFCGSLFYVLIIALTASGLVDAYSDWYLSLRQGYPLSPMVYSCCWGVTYLIFALNIAYVLVEKRCSTRLYAYNALILFLFIFWLILFFYYRFPAAALVVFAVIIITSLLLLLDYRALSSFPFVGFSAVFLWLLFLFGQNYLIVLYN